MCVSRSPVATIVSSLSGSGVGVGLGVGVGVAGGEEVVACSAGPGEAWASACLLPDGHGARPVPATAAPGPTAATRAREARARGTTALRRGLRACLATPERSTFGCGPRRNGPGGQLGWLRGTGSDVDPGERRDPRAHRSRADLRVDAARGRRRRRRVAARLDGP